MRFSQDQVLAWVVLLLVAGSIALAIIDPSTRHTFTDLTKVVIGMYIGLHIPAPEQKR